ncbi:hypothetical protein [Pectobacterium phage Wc4-1]|uniref:Uncharacterized protein n=1 Tax=Pectobacterium phage Wc4 TaxID=2652428 RepID=A0A5P8D469_9CAUD|nr:hypothetical protein [Pectobacterium phage Wc4]QFP94022.1 hypothetical protein [Pectobacterium phage Wc4-1]
MKKQSQLGMHPSTASAHLIKDILFKFVCDSGKNKCHHCGEPMMRDTFSVEHKTPWLDSDNPIELYFNLNNIGFSHLSCNIKASRNGRKVQDGVCHGTVTMYNRGCKCSFCLNAWNSYKRAKYTPEKRRKKYLLTGK